jgi:hypothetical protein
VEKEIVRELAPSCLQQAERFILRNAGAGSRKARFHSDPASKGIPAIFMRYIFYLQLLNQPSAQPENRF